MSLLHVVFFASGATGLIYQSIWARELHLLFGTSQFAIATVLAAFMGGLALGGAWIARRVDRVERPLRDYAALEAVIGLYALAFPWVIDLLAPAYLAAARAQGPSPDPVTFGLVQFALLGTALLLPTACMGATLPLLTRHLAPRAGEAGRVLGTLYALNTAGAVVGTWAAGFWFLPVYGVRTTTVLVAVGNLVLAGAALWIDRRAQEVAEQRRVAAALGIDLGREASWPEAGGTHEETPKRSGEKHVAGEPGVGAAEPPRPLRWILLVAALAGLSSLCLEVAWFRLLGLILGASTYAFTVMLLAFLVGIAGGGKLGGWLSQRAPDRAGVLRILAGVQLGVALTTWLGAWGYGALPLLFAKLWFWIDGDTAWMWPVKCVLAGSVMVVPALGMGATFPLLVHAATEGDAARPAGEVYAANTLGSVLGAFLGGFVLLPSLQVTGTVLACCSVNVVGAGVAWCLGEALRRGGGPPPPQERAAVRNAVIACIAGAGIVLAWAFPPAWNPMLMTSGMYKYVDNLDEPTMAEIKARMLDRYELLWYSEGLSTVITVARNKKTGNIWLANNGKVDASTTTDMPTQVLVAHLPFLFTQPEVERSGLIGLASGITLGAMTLHPEVRAIDVVELEPRMPDAARLFATWNRNALEDPRVTLLANDGRNQLLVTPPGTYDLVVSEPSNPWLTGVSNLFTREFFEMGKARLAPGGVWSQWVQMYGMAPRDLRSVLKTFCDVYPHVMVFSTIRDADLVMIGSDSPLTLDLARAQALVDRTPVLREELASIDVKDGHALLAHFLLDRDTALAFAGDVPLNTDDNLLVEFSAPQNLHRETSSENFLALLPNARVPVDAEPDAAGLLALAKVYADRDDAVRALAAVRAAEAREPGRADTLAAFEAYRAAVLGKGVGVTNPDRRALAPEAAPVGTTPTPSEGAGSAP